MLAGAMIAGLDWWVALLCVLVVCVGATIQSSIGFGLGLVATPLVGIADPEFVPVAMLMAIAPMAVAMAYRERHHVDRSGIGWAMIGRIPGSALGAWVVARADHATLVYLIAGSVLLAVLASATRLHVRPTRVNLACAGVASGFGGTAVSIGGPPMAIAYQHGNPATIRSTLAVFFLAGLLISVVSLGLAGVIGTRDLQLGALLVPGSLTGTAIGSRLAGRIPAGRMRPLILTVCTLSAVALIVEQLV